MILKEQHATAPTAPAATCLTGEQVAEVDDPETTHTDYDLQSLRVQGLEHYLQSPGDERFHVR
jgi:hypothetical protein